MKVINLFAGPGAGKSTTAAGLFHLMKLQGLNVELVTEFAKDLTWEKNHNALRDQVYVFAQQHRRLHRLEEQVEWVITDSPLLFNLIYMPGDYPGEFKDMVYAFWERFTNFNYFIQRSKPYVTRGRNETEEEAQNLDARIRELLSRGVQIRDRQRQQYIRTDILGDAEAPHEIYRNLYERDELPKYKAQPY